MSTSTPTLALLVTSLLLVGPAEVLAQAPPPDDGARSLSLQEALRLALDTSPEVDVADLARRAALARASGARGAFAPTAFLEGSYSSASIPTTSNFVSKNGRFSLDQIVVTTGLGGLLPSGTGYSMSLSVTGEDSSSGGASFRPSYATLAQLAVSQKLLKGGWGVLSNPARIADRDADAAAASLVALSSDLALAVVGAYWDLAAAQEGRRVAGESLEQAQEQLRATKLRIAAGRLSPLEEVSANATIAARQDQIVAAEQLRLGSESELLQLLALAAGPRARELRLPRAVRAADVPDAPAGEPAAPVLDREIERALRDRADLRALRARAAAARLEAETADHESLPDLSVTATVGVRGLAGTRRSANGRDPCDDTADPPNCAEPFFEGGLGESIGSTRRFPLFGVVARLELPVPGTAASRAADAAALDARARAAELERGEWTVRNQVRQAVFGLVQAQERLRTSGVALDLAEESLTGERRKFEAGVSTIFEVSSVQEALTSAQNARFAALARYHVAKATLAHRRGTLLSEMGLSRR